MSLSFCTEAVASSSFNVDSRSAMRMATSTPAWLQDSLTSRHEPATTALVEAFCARLCRGQLHAADIGYQLCWAWFWVTRFGSTAWRLPCPGPAFQGGLQPGLSWVEHGVEPTQNLSRTTRSPDMCVCLCLSIYIYIYIYIIHIYIYIYVCVCVERERGCRIGHQMTVNYSRSLLVQPNN